jgi:hypothetical protein
MKGIAGFLIAAVVFALVGAAALVAGRFERDMADAQRHLATLQYEDATARLADADRYAAYAGWVPGVSDGLHNELRVRRAAISYWQQQYDAVRPGNGDAGGATAGDDIELQLIMANAAFRAGQATAKDRPSTMQALDEAVGNYLGVLKSEAWNEDAAYNYEYLVRLRDEYAKSPRNAPPPPRKEKNSSNGQAGAPEATTDTRKFEIYIPLESTERTKAAEAGKATPNKKKG